MKKEKGIMVALMFAFLFLLGGCASITNPYNSEFTCPQAEKGKCIGIPQAYLESLKQSENSTEFKDYYPTLEEKKEVTNQEISEEQEVYADALFNKLSKILKEPETPVLTVPKVVRVLILPYRGDKGKTLYFSRYVYVITDEPKWVFDNLLIQESENEM